MWWLSIAVLRTTLFQGRALVAVPVFMNRSSRQLPSGPTVALVGPLAGENVSNSAAQARLAHLWSAAKLIAPTHAQLAQSYVYVLAALHPRLYLLKCLLLTLLQPASRPPRRQYASSKRNDGWNMCKLLCATIAWADMQCWSCSITGETTEDFASCGRWSICAR